MKIIFFMIFGISVFSQTINLEDFLTRVKNNHPLFSKEKRAVEIEEKNQEIFLGTEDWFISASPYYSYIKPIATGAFTPKSINNLGFEAKAERLFWDTGGQLSVSWNTGYINQNISDISFSLAPVIPEPIAIPSGPSELYQHGLYVAYLHPLMQNRNGYLNRLDYDLAQYAVDNAKIQSQENQELFLLEMALNFLEWALLDEQIKISNERLRLAQEQLDQVRERRRANLVDEVDVLRTQDAIRISMQNILLMQAQWKGKQAELASLSQSEDVINQSPDFDLFEQHQILTFEEVKDLIYKSSRPLQSLKTIQENIKHQREGLVELSKPQLNLNLRAGLARGEDTIGKSFLLDKPDYMIGLQYSYPLDNTTAKTNIQKADLQILQINDETKQVQLSLEAAARNLLVQIDELQKVMVLNKEQIESAKKKTEEEDKLYRQGRGQLTFVIQSRDSEESARFIYTQNAALYQNLVLQYQALTDQLFE